MENDIAFKVIVKNDGISDIIFKTLMLKGEAGGSISSIEKTSSVGVVDTYTITLNDGTTTTFEVTNGSNIESIEKTATSGLIDTYTVTLTNGDTTTFEVKNGEDAQLYELPQDCIVAYDKEPELHSLTGQHGYVAFDAYGIKNVKVTGYTHQKTTTGKNLFVKGNTASSSDVTYTVNADGSITLSGTSSATSFFTAFENLPITSGTYTLSSTGHSTIHFYIRKNTASGDNLMDASTSSATATLEAQNIAGIIRINSGTNCDGITLYPQLEAGSSPTSYEEYTGGIPSPNPDFPQDIIGYGTKELDGTYTVDIEVTDNDDNVYNITASGLAYPLYDGDVLDFENSKVIRANGALNIDQNDITAVGSSYTNIVYCRFPKPNDSIDKGNTTTNILCEKLRQNTATYGWDNIDFVYTITGGADYNPYWVGFPIGTSLSDMKTALDGALCIYKLATPTEESVTISGDTSIVENLRGWTQVDAWDEDVTLDVWYYSDVEFPDGYEEVGLPIDDLLYYQDQEYIEFPTNWGFAMGYVFDADEVRFMINVTKDLHDGFRVVANKSVNLALSIYTGSGGGSLTGFNLVDASFIREYGQIQLRLQTETAHGLTVGSLLGARVSQGRLRITFEED